MKVVLEVIAGPHKGQIFEFDRHDTFIVGRAKSAQFRLSDDDIFFSRNHFLVEVNPPLCRIMDLNSTNHTFVNGKPVTAADLHNGDNIRGGKTIIRVSIEEDTTPGSATPRRLDDATMVPRNWPQKAGGEKGTAPMAPVLSFEKDRHTQKESDRDLPTLMPSGNESQSGSGSAEVNRESLPSFPGYRTIRIIGRGGMGIVYEAESLSDGARVAVKVISPTVDASSGDLSRFIREAAILKELDHPNIVRFRDLNQSAGSLFIVMDYVAGRDAELVQRESEAPISVQRAVSWIVQLLDALKYAHGRGYIHRDVKPTNLLIAGQEPAETLFLGDFGLSRAYQSSKLSGLTVTGDIGGSTPFMPPEQITNYRNVDPSADQYSVAATLYYLLTRHHVYDFPRDVSRQLLMILQDEPIPISHRRNDFPPLLVKVIQKALSRDPSSRFPDIASFQKALKTVIKQTDGCE